MSCEMSNLQRRGSNWTQQFLLCFLQGCGIEIPIRPRPSKNFLQSKLVIYEGEGGHFEQFGREERDDSPEGVNVGINVSTNEGSSIECCRSIFLCSCFCPFSKVVGRRNQQGKEMKGEDHVVNESLHCFAHQPEGQHWIPSMMSWNRIPSWNKEWSVRLFGRATRIFNVHVWGSARFLFGGQILVIVEHNVRLTEGHPIEILLPHTENIFRAIFLFGWFCGWRRCEIS